MKNMDKFRNDFLKALKVSDWQGVVLAATEILKLDTSEPMVWSNRGVALEQLGFPLDAILNYDKSIELEEAKGIKPTINYANKGAAYWDMANAPKAKEYLLRAIENDPAIAQAHMTLGNVYKHEGNLSKAIDCYRASIKADHEYADGHLCLGMALLKNGDMKEGWKEYAWRWKTDQLPPRKFRCPHWNGEDLTGKTILVHGEQGLGDIIQFSRYVRVLGNQFPRAKIVVEGRHQVKRLLNTIIEAYAVVNVGEKLPVCDYEISMIDLAALYTPSINLIPAIDREFLLRPDDVEAWGNRLQPLIDLNPEAKRVGICWAGMSRDTHPSAAAIDTLRSAALMDFAPLMKVPNVIWLSLQKGPPAEQIKARPNGMIVGDFTDDMFDFYETACAIENCDLVITVDTAVAHVAASIGKETWMLSRWDGCWRWFGNRSDSPWYPSLRQFEQPKPHDWEGLMVEVATELRKFAVSKNEPEFNLTLAK